MKNNKMCNSNGKAKLQSEKAVRFAGKTPRYLGKLILVVVRMIQ